MNILAVLKSEASNLQQQLDTLNSAMRVLGGKNSVSRQLASRGKRTKKRRMSASARARIAKAQRARWAKIRAKKKNA